MTKESVIALAAIAGKAFAVAFYMELERRLGKTKHGSVLGLVFSKLSSTLKEKPKKS